MIRLLQPYELEIAIVFLVINAAIALIFFGYWMGRKTRTDATMGTPRANGFDPGPIGAEKSEMDDAFYTPEDYEGEK